MKWALRRSGRAIDDLADIWDYIAADNVAAADKLVRSLLALFEKTADFPQLGHAAEEIAPEIRILSRGNYILIYRLIPAEKTVELVRVVHGARDWPALLET